MKKKLCSIICICGFVSMMLFACGKSTNFITMSTAESDGYITILWEGAILFKEANVTNIPDGLESEYEWNSSEIEKLREKYPEYFELGTFKGLEVYVWQTAKSDYRFGLMQGTNREKTLEERMALKGATSEEMALILSTFDIENKDIFVIPWQNPISSYMVTDDMVKDPEYIANVRIMLGLNLDEK